jgi:hypothetical protein
VSDREWLAERFEEQRPRLRRIAYRMLDKLARLRVTAHDEETE